MTNKNVTNETSSIEEYNILTKNENGIDIEVNNLNVGCITSQNNKFSIDKDGNIIGNSIKLATGDTSDFSLIFDKIYPVNSIYISVSATNPSTFMGGTWKQIAQGRTLVGVDPSQTEFNTVKKTGGSKYIQDHFHQTYLDSGGNETHDCAGYSWCENIARPYPASTGVKGVETGNCGNLQPYFTCYFWCRTA